MTISVHNAAAVVFNPTAKSDPQTGSYTISAGSNRRLLVFVAWEIVSTSTPQTITTVTWGGQTLTRVRGNTDNVLQTTTEHMDLWTLDEAGIAAGSGTTLSVDFSGSGSDAVAMAIVLTGSAGALSVVDSADSANHDVGSISVSIGTVVSGNWVVAAISNEASDGAGFTPESAVDVEDIDGANASANAGIAYSLQRATNDSGSVTMGVTACGNTDKDMVIIAAEIEEASSAHTGTGTVTVPGPTVSGGGEQPHSGSAAITVPAPTISGTGVMHPSGTSSVAVNTPNIVATGVQLFTGTASLSLNTPDITASGTSLSEHTGTGSITASAPEITGTGQQPHQGTGAVIASTPDISGTGEQPHAGTSSIVASTPSIEALGIIPPEGTAIIIAPTPEVVGTGTGAAVVAAVKKFRGFLRNVGKGIG